MANVKIVIKDEVNAVLKGLDPETLNECREVLTYYVPGFVHMPSYRLGRWDGQIRLMKASGATHINLLDQIFPILDNNGYHVEIVEEYSYTDDVSAQLQYIDETYLSEYTKDGNPITLWDHQVTAVNTCIKEGQGILELATGAGKTIICGIMSKIWQEFGRVVVIVPSIDLVVQTQYWFQQIGVQSGIWYGERKERGQTTVSTWQSIDHFPELFADVKCVIVDEVHQAKAQILNEILCGPAARVPFRFGCTGSMPKEDLYRNQILAAVGPVIYTLRSKELQEKGVLAEATIYQLTLNDERNDEYMRVRDNFTEWREEVSWMFTSIPRMEYIANPIRDVTEDYGNTLVLVQYRKSGKELQKYLPDAPSLDGNDKSRAEHYKRFNEGDNQVLICTLGIASTGIDIPRIFNLVIIEPGKKFEKVVQTLGRGLRKAEDKSHLNVFDISGNARFAKKHAALRRGIYRDARQECNVIDVEYYHAE